jgi:hypothetical protein
MSNTVQPNTLHLHHRRCYFLFDSILL